MRRKNNPATPWVAALLVAGVTVLVYSLLFPLYRLWDYIIAFGLAAALAFAVYNMAKGVDTSKSAPSQVKFEPTGNDAVDGLIKRGQEMLSAIREENRLIPDEALSSKMEQLDDVANRIFKTVVDQPGKAPQIRRFMDYYLPTTLKMLTGYRKMDERRVSGDNAQATRRQIENAMDVVLKAFNKQLDTMYQDDMLDISTDIDVLETMLKQDGLIDSGLKGAKKEEE